MKAILAVAYVVLLVPSLLLSAVVWEKVAVDKLFYCSDSMGFPLNFKPPFVHRAERRMLRERDALIAAPMSGGTVKDYYFIAPSLVYLLWAIHVMVALALPGIVFGIVRACLPSRRN